MKQYALIVAGGNGSRMESEIPKQFLHLKGRPLLMYTINAFVAEQRKIIVVLPPSHIDYWKKLCEEFNFRSEHQIVAGGESRFHSVRNGLSAITGEGLIAIHDGVRPLVTRRVIDESFSVTREKGNAIAAVKLKDSIRELIKDGKTRYTNRANYYLVQTPQTFRVSLIKQAYAGSGNPSFTDDAGILEEHGESIHLIEGEYSNIKVTTPDDLRIAEALVVGEGL